ncbi:MAG: hypothetical protein WD448_11125 [Woeseia sp.]
MANIIPIPISIPIQPIIVPAPSVTGIACSGVHSSSQPSCCSSLFTPTEPQQQAGDRDRGQIQEKNVIDFELRQLHNPTGLWLRYQREQPKKAMYGNARSDCRDGENGGEVGELFIALLSS